MIYLLLCFVFMVFAVIFRVLFVVATTLKGYRKYVKRNTKDKINTVIVVGSGGHTSEMMCLVQSLDPNRYSPRLYIMASSDKWSEQKIVECEDKFKSEHFNSDYSIFKIPRSRSVHQSYFTSVFTTLYSTLASFPILVQFNPDLILCNGPGTCVPICVISFILRCSFISENKVIFVESICRVKSLSLTGKILQWFADEILVQWPEMTAVCKRAKYIGRVL
jgi:beta-1,4-N-acetylglucosaminyltransferase